MIFPGRFRVDSGNFTVRGQIVVRGFGKKYKRKNKSGAAAAALSRFSNLGEGIFRCVFCLKMA